MIKYIIVDDEPIAHDIIKEYCGALPHLHFVADCYDAIEAMECLRSKKVDLVFLDLNMPKLKGFEFLRVLQQPPKVIVTTAYQEYALEGYELNIVDYLLKPFGFERFVKAIHKLSPGKEETPASNVSTGEEGLFLRSNKQLVQVKVQDILFIESLGNYIKVVTKSGEIQVREKISDILNLLPDKELFQVHKSFVVAKRHIHMIEGNRIFVDGHIVPIGKTYKANVNRLFRQ